MSDWTPDYTEAAMEEFGASRPTVSRKLVLGLWQYWLDTGAERLFRHADDDVALIQHARAYGAHIPSTFNGLLREHAGLFGPLFPEPLVWGPRANLTLSGGSAPDSRIMSVWVYRDHGEPSGVLIIGDGLPELREQLLPEAFLTSLTIGTLDSDLVGAGAIRLELPLAGRPQLTLPLLPLGAHPGFLPGEVPRTAREALRRFVRDLRQIADRTGLLQLHQIEVSGVQDLYAQLSERARSGSRPVLWVPPEAEVAALMPRFLIPSGQVLRLRLSGDLLTTAEYSRLEKLYRRRTIDQIKADLMLGRDNHVKEAERLDHQHEAYKDTPLENRAEMWGGTVLVSHMFDHDADVSIRYAYPKTIDADDFYLRVVPVVAGRRRTIAEYYDAVVDSLDAADASPDAPIRRLAAGRFLDAAVRHRGLDGSPALVAAFAAWSDQVRPMLALEWRRTLRQAGIAVEDAFSASTIMHTVQGRGTHGMELMMIPHTVIQPGRSAVLFDPERAVMVVRDAASDARAAASRISAAEIEERWSALEEAAAGDQTEFDAALLAALRDAPQDIVARMLRTLTTSPVDPQPLADLEGQLPEAQRRFRVARLLHAAATTMGNGATQTARAALRELRDAPVPLRVRAALLEAVLEFFEAGGNPKTDAQNIASGYGAGANQRVLDATRRASATDEEFTMQWMSLLGKVELSSAAGRLLFKLPSLSESLGDGRMLAAYLSRMGVESARLARMVQQAANSLSEDGEPHELALAKLGRALEETFTDEFVGGSRDTAVELMAILTQQEARGMGGS
jgi:hypothetical protein